MSGNFDKVLAVMDYFGFNPNVNEYKWRFLLQKITFLAQSLGLSTNYSFTPYIKGPYSPTLTSDYYSRSNELSPRSSGYQLTESEIHSLDKITEYCDFESLSILESTSTFVYIITQESGTEDDEIFVRSKTLKPHFSDSQLIIGMTKAKQLLFKDEYLTDELKQEIDMWDNLE